MKERNVMKPDETIADLPDGCRISLSERLLLDCLADRVFDAQLEDGSYLPEPSKTSTWIRQLLKAARIPPKPRSAVRPPQPRWDTCPRCGHVHGGIGQCGMEMGGGGLCRCEMEVAV